MFLKMTSQHCIWTLIMLFIILINLTGQSCQFIDSPLLKKISSISLPSSPSTSISPLLSSLSPSADSSEVSRDSNILISDSPSLSPLPLTSSSSSTSSQSMHLPTDANKISNTLQTIQLNHGLKRKRYQPARYLVKPLWLNPKYTWKVLQMNSSRNDAKQAEIKKLRDKKRAKICKLADKMKQATLVSKKLYLLLNEISMSLSD